jgi:hypothetical protein
MNLNMNATLTVIDPELLKTEHAMVLARIAQWLRVNINV